VLIRRAPM